MYKKGKQEALELTCQEKKCKIKKTQKQWTLSYREK